MSRLLPFTMLYCPARVKKGGESEASVRSLSGSTGIRNAGILYVTVYRLVYRSSGYTTRRSQKKGYDTGSTGAALLYTRVM